jgi:hypothetical protein
MESYRDQRVGDAGKDVTREERMADDVLGSDMALGVAEPISSVGEEERGVTGAEGGRGSSEAGDAAPWGVGWEEG